MRRFAEIVAIFCGIVSAIAAALSVPWINYFPSAKSTSLSNVVDEPVIKENPSFFCDQAVTWAEIAICSDGRLARVDRILNSKFYALYNRLDQSSKKDLQVEQRMWISHMRECEPYGDGVDCLMRKYSHRIQALDKRFAAL